jgi:alpha-galactosidase
MKRSCVYVNLLVAFVAIGLASFAFADSTVSLSTLDITKMSSGWGTAQANKSVVGKEITLNGHKYSDGVGTHARSVLYVQLDGKAKNFTAVVGVDDETEGKGTVNFKVTGDGNTLFESGLMKGNESARTVNVSLAGISSLVLIAGAGDDRVDHDHADWADAKIVYAGAAPVAIDAPNFKEEPYFLTPKPGPAPKINGPELYGGRPGHFFIYRIPCTGKRPMTFAVDKLPESLRLDEKTGIITGDLPKKPGEYLVQLKAKNEAGADERLLKLVVGDVLALTPPMGWNHWYTYYDRVDDQLFRSAADSMIQTGMADFGYQYVNIDDCWMMKPGSTDPMLNGELRDKDGAVNPNKRFPNMNALCDHIHGLGLKAGIYISPGPKTCAGYTGSYQHEKIDAERFAEWGFDFLKYDWCYYAEIAKDKSLEEYKKPYQLMGDILKGLDRDIILNLCQYGMGEVWKWGGEVGGHCWRTTDDLGNRADDSLPGFYYIGFSNAEHAEYAKPGQWNDPDYILIGRVGGSLDKDNLPPYTKLTASEQYSYMSMWCLMASPLVYSGDITHMDEFTLNVLCNSECIAVDQDPLGKQARVVRKTDVDMVLAKPLQDGSLAVGLFNLSDQERLIEANWADLQLKGSQRIRDLWRQKDIDSQDKQVSFTIRRHGVSFIRLWPKK